jgi:hypothetical protein
MDIHSKHPDRVRGERTPEKEKPLSETHQGPAKKHKPIVPPTLDFKAVEAHFFIAESLALLLALVLTWGVAYGL